MNSRYDAESIIGATRCWLEKCVIGLNLCPFANAVYVSDRIRYRISDAVSPAALVQDLAAELEYLRASDPERCETTLLIHPSVLIEFDAYNAFLETADVALENLGFAGVIQIASFHPRYRFAGAGPDDIENFTNRSPHPMLHLLRESSVARAVAAFGDTNSIYQGNIETMRRLGHEGWARLLRDQT